MIRVALLFVAAIVTAGPASAGCQVMPYTSSGYELDGHDVLMQGAQADFNTSPFGGGNPPGCRCTYEAVACRSDGQPATQYRVEVIETVGWGSRLESHLVNGCVRHAMTLGVDHSGVGGKVCRSPSARITLRTFFPVTPAALPPLSPPDPRDSFESR